MVWVRSGYGDPPKHSTDCTLQRSVILVELMTICEPAQEDSARRLMAPVKVKSKIRADSWNEGIGKGCLLRLTI